MQVQITLISNNGRRPLNAIIECQSWVDYQEHKVVYREKAIARICANRYMSIADLKRYGYTTIQAKIYHKDNDDIGKYDLIRQKKEV